MEILSLIRAETNGYTKNSLNSSEKAQQFGLFFLCHSPIKLVPQENFKTILLKFENCSQNNIRRESLG